MTFVRAWKNGGGHEDVLEAGTTEVHFKDGRVVQITCAEGDDLRGDGTVMLRVWGPNGTHEYGGDNQEDLCLVFEVGELETRIEDLRFSGSARHRRNEASASA